MQPPPNADHLAVDRSEPLRSLRVRQADAFEALVAAAEAQDLSTAWIADRFVERERVLS